MSALSRCKVVDRLYRSQKNLFGAFGGVGGGHGFDESFCSGPPPSPRFEDEGDELGMVLVSLPLVVFTCLCCGRVVVCVGMCVFRALTHSVGHADVDEVVPCVCGAGDVHDGFAGLSLVVGVV